MRTKCNKKQGVMLILKQDRKKPIKANCTQ